MRDINNVCHIAIPCKDLDTTVEFYEKIGCKLARRKKDRVTFNFFGDQLVCHLDPKKVPQDISFYPYHFGVTFSERADFEKLLENLSRSEITIQSLTTRFKDKPDEHRTFFIADPSNNVLEFKYYLDQKMKY